MNVKPCASPIVRSHGAVDVFHQFRFTPQERANEQVINALIAVLILVHVSPPYIHVQPHIIERFHILVELDHGSGEARGAQIGFIPYHNILAQLIPVGVHHEHNVTHGAHLYYVLNVLNEPLFLVPYVRNALQTERHHAMLARLFSLLLALLEKQHLNVLFLLVSAANAFGDIHTA